jgi:hypothetical protein
MEGPNMINVQGCGICVKLDSNVINCIKFIKEKQLLVGPIFEKDTYDGYVKDHQVTCIHLEREQWTINAKWIINPDNKWVEANFDNRFLGQI